MRSVNHGTVDTCSPRELKKKIFVYFLFHGEQHQEQLCLHSPGILHKRIVCLQYHHLVGEKL